MNSIHIHRDKPYSWRWTPEDDECFFGRLTYDVLHDNPSFGNTRFFKSLWEVKALPNAQVLVWMLLDRLPSRLNLSRRGINITNLFYLLCQLCQEPVQHLFLECEVVFLVWNTC